MVVCPSPSSLGMQKSATAPTRAPLSCIRFFFQMFRKLHNSYTDVMCNPFYNPGDRIQSRWGLLFDNMVIRGVREPRVLS